MKYKFEQFNASNSWHQHYAAMISYWSTLSESILPLHPDDMAEHPYGVLIQDLGVNGLLGYLAIKDLSEEGVGQVGSLIVNPYHRGENIALLGIEYILKNATQKLPELTAGFAYANQYSKSSFLANGGVLVGFREPLAATGCNYIIDLTAAMGLVVPKMPIYE